MSDAFTAVVASLAAAISLLERGGKKAAPSDRMFDQMLADYRKALEGGREAIARLDALVARNAELEAKNEAILKRAQTAERNLRSANEMISLHKATQKEAEDRANNAEARLAAQSDALAGSDPEYVAALEEVYDRWCGGDGYDDDSDEDNDLLVRAAPPVRDKGAAR